MLVLNECQQEAFDRLNYFIKKPYSSEKMLLSGPAGTGKTTLVIELIKNILEKTGFRVACTAPTNKAVKVLSNIFNRRNIEQKRLIFTTIHSLLALQESINDIGDIEFKKVNKFAKLKINEYDIIIVDESSMLSDELFGYINKYQNSKKIIFIGDEYQIPPVNSDRGFSIPFTRELHKKYDITELNLNQIMRQAVDNPIISLSTGIRKSILENKTEILTEFEDRVDNDRGIYYYRWGDMAKREAIISKIDELFLSGAYKRDSDYIKILAWKNDTVNKFSSYVRSKLYGDDIPKIVVGERLIADRPILIEKNVIYSTNDEFSVKSVETKTMNFLGEDIKYYRAMTNHGHYINILHEDSDEIFAKLIGKLKDNAKKEEFGSIDSKKKWKYYYDKLNTFVFIKYSYAITIHKSQGSTLDNVIVFYNDIKKNQNNLEKSRIMYTACTRPRNNLYIVY